MRVLRSLNEIAAFRLQNKQRSIVTIGSFDGIHRAHVALLDQVSRRAIAYSAASVAVSFEPHPLAVIAPSRMPKLLTPLDMKLELIAATGIEQLLLIPFTAELSQWTPEHFVSEVLVKSLQSESVIVGENFRFGHRQAGTPELLLQLGKQYGFTAEIFPKIILRGRAVSSSEIRTLLEDGKVPQANRLLGRPYSVRGPIEAGLGIGSKQTVSTFNLGTCEGLRPATGVYITRTRLFDENGHEIMGTSAASSVTNIGTRPTFGDREIGIETHLLEPPPDSRAGRPVHMEVSFLYRLRDERKFDSPSALLSQIQRDIERAHRYFRRLKRFVERH